MGNGAVLVSLLIQLGVVNVAPLRPHFEQRAHARSLSLDVSAPQRIISGTYAIGA